MSGITAKAETAATDVARGFESIPHRLKVLAIHVGEAIAHPFSPPAVKIALPMLLDVIEDLRQEVAELRKPCPCAPAATFTTAEVVQPPAPGVSTSATTENTPEVVQPAPVDLAAKWPDYEAQLAAFNAGQMSEAEAAAFAPVHAQVQAFAASLKG